jgi:nucleoside triphosphatase
MSEQIYPEPTVGGLIFNNENKIFLLKTHKWGHRYAIPGGHIEVGETMVEALIREIKEETNLDIFDIQYKCFFEVIFDPQFMNRKHFIFFDFTCRTNGGEVILNEEAEEFEWVTLEEALTMNLEDNTHRFLTTFV